MILDVNVLIYAIDADSLHHTKCANWLTTQLNSATRTGLPMQTITAFMRITTNPRIFPTPLGFAQARDIVDGWLQLPGVWIPQPSLETWENFREISGKTELTSKLIPDAMLAALSKTYGVPVVSADQDFARFPGISWVNPLD
ncbi:MAG: TA system VapC family ribonuclease toxin [Mobiluncus porci]|uniref:Ribonuclease VapC n=1 Tax=Mobiluncus porci TaxID=2652278 RepID=A0A7K0K3X8_9ACTO|nr:MULTISPECIES: TA system VapC family ribonuclease toxin [Mobiluncus]MCI6585054.1 PIN domain-containing protein [Mobiluncus sp.]MDD7542055.1 PIN domain-containing protein [Mobiluncus porci]MDY5749398.1 TA system VapC family ribonuclease toxin [Mobiluncus porci]MST50134.1 type II toxin-antitoxin system VapC family toxin [Mobiluncus porci]